METKANFLSAVALSLALMTALGSDELNAQNRLYDNTFSLSDVELLDGPFRHAMDLNVKVLLEYDTDRLLAPFLHEAGLPKKAEYFPNWEGLDGHIGGHYVSALAIHYAASGSQECYDRLKYVLAELERCQDANGNGYVGGVPNGTQIWSEVGKGNFGPLHGAWVPWYNVHKMFAGLRDAWQYAGIDEAKEMFLKFCDWALDITKDLTDGQMDQMVSQEFGGMDEVLADAFAITGDRKYMTAAKRFAHHLILDSMAEGVDNLDNKHANTQVPKVVGYARIADLDDDDTFKDAAEFFWDRVANHRSVVIGGNSRSEHFPAAADYKSYVEHREGPESCNTNNMLKLTQFLFKMDQEARYADFYERAMYN
ncbi:MAG: glycoside hydrolase family 127 protein, partial [Acidaminococcaceae bacterium]|nr:glycoside hydrolase family 127 protein [Acidaminococcaceae bacterium]